MSAGSPTCGLRCIAAATVLAAALLAQAAGALDVPALKGRVNDYAGLLSADAQRSLEVLLKELERTDSTQIAVLTVASLEGDSLEEFSIRAAEAWRIGQKGRDNGALLLISRADRKVRIEVGRGLEGRLTDLQSGRIIRNTIVPAFKAGRFDQGVLSGVQAMIDVVRGEFRADDKPAEGVASLTDYFPFLVLFVFLVFALGRISRGLGTVGGGALMPFLGQMALAPGLGWLIALAGIGLASGFIIALIAGLAPAMGSGHYGRRSGGGTGGFPGGFPSGGGFSSGGGGFSGGGGSFGGGGASGSW